VLLFAPSKASVDSTEVCEDAVLAEGAVNDTAEDEKTKKEHQFNSIIIPELKKGDDCDITVIGCAMYSLRSFCSLSCQLFIVVLLVCLFEETGKKRQTSKTTMNEDTDKR
jgi:hypothetical protein